MGKNQKTEATEVKETEAMEGKTEIVLKENWINKVNKWNDETRLARAEKKAKREQDKAAKKAEKENSEKKKIPVGAKIAGGLALAGAIGTAVVKVIQNQNTVDTNEQPVSLTDGGYDPPAEIPETVEPQETVPEES